MSITQIFAPLFLALDDPLRVGIEIVPGLQMRAQKQNEARVGVVRRRPVDARPESIACAGAGGANIGVAVVAVDAPGVKNPLMIEQLMAGPADVIHDLVAAVFLQRFSYPRRRCRRALRPN